MLPPLLKGLMEPKRKEQGWMCSNRKVARLGLLYPLRVQGLGHWEHRPSMQLCTRSFMFLGTKGKTMEAGHVTLRVGRMSWKKDSREVV